MTVKTGRVTHRNYGTVVVWWRPMIRKAIWIRSRTGTTHEQRPTYTNLAQKSIITHDQTLIFKHNHTTTHHAAHHLLHLVICLSFFCVRFMLYQSVITVRREQPKNDEWSERQLTSRDKERRGNNHNQTNDDLLGNNACCLQSQPYTNQTRSIEFPGTEAIRINENK